MALEQSVVVRISKQMVHQKIDACDPFVKALIQILIGNVNRVSSQYVMQNKVAEKLLNDLKATAAKSTE